MIPNDLVAHLRLMLRADMIMAELKFRQIAAKAVLMGFAALFAAFGVVMLGIAGFLALEKIYGATCAALITGGAGIGLAVLAFVIALCVRPPAEMAEAAEVHARSAAALAQDFDATAANAQRLVSNPLGSGLPALLVPLAGLLLRRWLSRR